MFFFSTGQVPTADDFLPVARYKQVDETAPVSSATVQDDDELVIPGVVPGRYALLAWIAYSSASSTPDIRHDFFAPAGTTMERTTFAQGTGASATSGSIHTETAVNPGTDVLRGTLAGNTLSMLIVGGMTVSTAGTVGFRWGQGTSDSNSVTVRAGSWLWLARLA
ncbi:hypothetical protein AB0875_12500 [Micromonospora gifhornensis]|uniref:hypothetical protein n=1 Tax=Micromonospora gifhornensis TaxID=84594 RepID=UPI0034538BEF